MKRVLIFGVSSLIGSNLARALRAQHRVYGTYVTHAPRIDDILTFPVRIDPKTPLEEFLLRMRPDVVVYSAGAADHRSCLRDPIGTLFVHSEAPTLVASTLQRWQGRLFYLSSSKVFSGSKGNYGEEDETDPETPYGQVKREAEMRLLQYENVFALRLGTVFGLTSFERPSFLQNLLARLCRKERVTLIDDEFRNFLAVADLSHALSLLMEVPSEQAGLYHLSNGQRASYHAFGQAVAEVFALPASHLSPISGSRFSVDTASNEPRGEDLTLNGALFHRTFGWAPSRMEDSLETLRRALRDGSQ